MQGVGFRWFVYENANKFNLSGFVKNLSDGSVEFELQGDSIVVGQVISIIKKGRGFIDVQKIEIKALPVKRDKKFYIS